MTEYKRNCPKCNKDMYYTYSTGLHRSILNNSVCRRCSKLGTKTPNRRSSLLTKEHTLHISIGHKNNNLPFYTLYNKVLTNAKYRHKPSIECSLTYNEFVEFTKITNCSYCGSNIIWNDYRTSKYIKGVTKTGYNLDRKNNNIGYTKDNCVVCCSICNNVKSNKFTYNEMLLIGKTISEIKKLRVSQE